MARLLKTALIALCLSAGAAGAEPLPESEWLPKSEWFAYACGRPVPKLDFCKREIRRVNAKMRKLEADFAKTGRGYGTSFTYCAADCMETYPELEKMRR